MILGDMIGAFIYKKAEIGIIFIGVALFNCLAGGRILILESWRNTGLLKGAYMCVVRTPLE